MLLLGAGASVDAGLAPSAGLTKSIAEQLGRGCYPDPVGQLPHVVVGAMIRRDASAGGDAFAVPDVERVFSAVRDLKRRDALDISAFVERWRGPVDAATGPSGLPESWGRQFRDALVGGYAGALELEAAFERGVVAMTEGRPSILFAELEHRVLGTLIRLLQVDDVRLGYLSPMLEVSDLTAIATLNYDLAVEGAAGQLGKSLDTGLDERLYRNWSSRREWLRDAFQVAIDGQAEDQDFTLLVQLRNAVSHGAEGLTGMQRRKLSEQLSLERDFRSRLEVSVDGRRIRVTHGTAVAAVRVGNRYVRALDAVAAPILVSKELAQPSVRGVSHRIVVGSPSR